MRKIFGAVLGSCLLMLSVPVVAATAAPSVPELVISQFKITSSDGQSITLYNQTPNVLDLSNYELDYINSSGKSTSISMSGTVPAGGYFILNDDQLTVCFRQTIAASSLSLSTTGGRLEVWKLADLYTKNLQDSVGWGKDHQALPAQNTDKTVSLLRTPLDSANNPVVTAPGAGSWQAAAPTASDPCQLQIIKTTTPVPPPTTVTLLPSTPPPVTILNVLSGGPMAPHIPASDAGLMAPVLNELLPNPAKPQTDANDEFMEVYNPNTAPFDLSGFKLQYMSTSSSTKHTYTFPEGTMLAGKSFTAFYAPQTHLSLSNSGGQVWLLDSMGGTLGKSDAYGTAKDGVTWALANGTWYWTTNATPGKANVITVATGSASGKTISANGNSTHSNAAQSGSPSGSTVAASNAASVAPTPVHPFTLALVGGLALLYGAYEYRHDMANRIHQFRANRSARRANR